MLKFACNISTLFGEVEFFDRFARAAAAGFPAVEFHEPYAYQKDRLADLVAEHRLAVALFNLPMGSAAEREAGIACLPDRKGEFRDGVGRAIEYARALGCRQLNCLAGIAPAGVPHSKLIALLTENLAFAAEALDRAGMRLMVEPLNGRDVPGFVLTRSSDVIAAIEATGSRNVFLQYDFYHAHVMGEDIALTVERQLSQIGHVQFSDHPGRHEPGTGDIDFSALFGQLDRLGYSGWVGAEYRPSAGTDASLGWYRPYRGA